MTGEGYLSWRLACTIGFFDVPRGQQGRLPSEIRLRQPSDAVPQAVQYRATLDLREWQQPAPGDLGVDDGVEPRRKLGRVALEVVLEIESQAAGVPVRRANERPGIVDDKQLRVIERRRSEVDPAPPGKHLCDLSVGRPLDEPEVPALGQHDVDLHTTESRHSKRRDERKVREEVWRGDTNRPASLGEGAEDRHDQRLEILVWPISNAAGDQRARDFASRRPGRPGQMLTGCKRPIKLEGAQQLANHRSLDSEMDVLRRVRRVKGQQTGVPDVQASTESHSAIDDHQLAVVPKVE